MKHINGGYSPIFRPARPTIGPHWALRQGREVRVSPPVFPGLQRRRMRTMVPSVKNCRRDTQKPVSTRGNVPADRPA